LSTVSALDYALLCLLVRDPPPGTTWHAGYAGGPAPTGPPDTAGSIPSSAAWWMLENTYAIAAAEPHRMALSGFAVGLAAVAMAPPPSARVQFQDPGDPVWERDQTTRVRA